MKIGRLVLSYNTSPWIKACWRGTEGLLDRQVMIQGTKPMKRVHNVPSEPDNTVEIVEKNFPDVEIIYTDTNRMVPLWNSSLEKMLDCDFVFRFDSDEIFSRGDWKKMIEFVRESNPKAVNFDFGHNSVVYYHDLDHGVSRDFEFYETRGIRTDYRFSGRGAFPCAPATFDHLDTVCHHLTYWKGIIGSKDFIDNKVDFEGTYARDVEKKHGRWLKAPQKIRTLFL